MMLALSFQVLLNFHFQDHLLQVISASSDSVKLQYLATVQRFTQCSDREIGEVEACFQQVALL
jgi:hypothetical protein